MTPNLQTTFANAFSSMKILELLPKFHWSFFSPRVQLTTCQHWFEWWLGAEQGTRTKGDKIPWHMYASIGLDELAHYLSSRQSKFCRRHIERRLVHWIFLNLIELSFKIVPLGIDRQKSTLVSGQAKFEPMVTTFEKGLWSNYKALCKHSCRAYHPHISTLDHYNLLILSNKIHITLPFCARYIVFSRYKLALVIQNMALRVDCMWSVVMHGMFRCKNVVGNSNNSCNSIYLCHLCQILSSFVSQRLSVQIIGIVRTVMRPHIVRM